MTNLNKPPGPRHSWIKISDAGDLAHFSYCRKCGVVRYYWWYAHMPARFWRGSEEWEGPAGACLRVPLPADEWDPVNFIMGDDTQKDTAR